LRLGGIDHETVTSDDAGRASAGFIYRVEFVQFNVENRLGKPQSGENFRMSSQV
jgi:hypothetical protein